MTNMGILSAVWMTDQKRKHRKADVYKRQSLDALTARASQLSGISIDAPRHVIGKNTIECMKSGVQMCIRDRYRCMREWMDSRGL